MKAGVVGIPQKRKLSPSEIAQELEEARQQLKEMNFRVEADLKARGYDSAVITGIDEAYRLNFIGNKLKSLKIDPSKTHIPFFEDQVDEHFEFIKKGLPKNDELYEEKLTALNKLYDDIQKQITNKQLSYEYWLKWNYDLLYSVSRKDDRPRYMVNMNRFPPSDGLFLPTTKGLGAMALNNTWSNNMFPLGIVNKPTVADGALYSPVAFFKHDINHSWDGFEGPSANNGAIVGLKKAVYQTIEEMNLSAREREMAELAYFLRYHELEEVRNIVDDTKIYVDILPSHLDASNSGAVESYAEEAEEVFDKILERVRTQSPDIEPK